MMARNARPFSSASRVFFFLAPPSHCFFFSRFKEMRAAGMAFLEDVPLVLQSSITIPTLLYCYSCFFFEKKKLGSDRVGD